MTKFCIISLMVLFLSCGVVEEIESVSETYTLTMESDESALQSVRPHTFEGEIDLFSSEKVKDKIEEIKRVEIEKIEVIGNGIPVRNVSSFTLYVVPAEDSEPYPFAQLPDSMEGITSVLYLQFSDIDLFPFLQDGRYLSLRADVTGITSTDFYIKLELTVIGSVKKQ